MPQKSLANNRDQQSSSVVGFAVGFGILFLMMAGYTAQLLDDRFKAEQSTNLAQQVSPTNSTALASRQNSKSVAVSLQLSLLLLSIKIFIVLVTSGLNSYTIWREVNHLRSNKNLRFMIEISCWLFSIQQIR